MRRVLTPWLLFETCEVDFAARWAGVTPKCVRAWCAVHGLGKKIGGRWRVSRIAFAMWIDGNREALARYHAGDRGPEVLDYLTRMQAPRGGF